MNKIEEYIREHSDEVLKWIADSQSNGSEETLPDPVADIPQNIFERNCKDWKGEMIEYAELVKDECLEAAEQEDLRTGENCYLEDAKFFARKLDEYKDKDKDIAAGFAKGLLDRLRDKAVWELIAP